MINMNCEMQLEENRNPLPMDNQMCKLGVTSVAYLLTLLKYDLLLNN